VTSPPDATVAEIKPVTLGRILVDDASFREWYDACLPRVYGYLFNRCGRNADVAEELTQQTFVEAVRSRRYVDRGEPVSWLIGIARHRLLDHFRRLDRRERGFLRLVANRPPQAIWMGTGDEDGRVNAALDGLPAAQRAAIVLRYLDDLPVREVARLLGRSEGAVESLLSRGREALRHSLAEDKR
jgi:RNA polymerase sigma-70 factor (ECF subfamily)